MPMMNFIPCDGTDGCVPFRPSAPMSGFGHAPAGIVGNGRRDGTARAPRCKRKKVKTLSPTLGIAGESPQHSEDLQRKARPEGGTPKQLPAKKTAFEHTLKKDDRTLRSFVLMIYICSRTK